MNHKEKISAEAAVNRAAMAIRVISIHAELLSASSETMAQWFDKMDEAFRVLRATDDSNEVLQLHARLERLRELRNMMELGSWQIHIKRVMDEAWRRLPLTSPQATERRAMRVRGAQLIAEERRRQIEVEEWTEEHDDAHGAGDLACAAMAYTHEAVACQGNWKNFPRVPKGQTPKDWPWSSDWWKPTDDPIRNLVKAGALIAAEIDRLQRVPNVPDQTRRASSEAVGSEVNLQTHFRNGTPRDDVCYCGMHQGPKAINNTCSQCGYIFPNSPNNVICATQTP